MSVYNQKNAISLSDNLRLNQEIAMLQMKQINIVQKITAKIVLDLPGSKYFRIEAA